MTLEFAVLLNWGGIFSANSLSFPNETRVAEQLLLVHYRVRAGNVGGDTSPLGAAAEAKPPGSTSCPGVAIPFISFQLGETTSGDSHEYPDAIEGNSQPEEERVERCEIQDIAHDYTGETDTSEKVVLRLLPHVQGYVVDDANDSHDSRNPEELPVCIPFGCFHGIHGYREGNQRGDQQASGCGQERELEQLSRVDTDMEESDEQ